MNANVSGTSLEGNNLIYRNADISNSVVGFATYVCPNSFLRHAKIGRFCSIASNVRIVDATHPLDMVTTYPGFFNTCNNLPFGKGTVNKKEFLTTEDGFSIEIGNDVWVGEGVMFLGGVKIGDGAVIGANALVTKDVPPYAVVGGVPAKVIRYRMNPEQIEDMLAIKWWDWPVDIIKERREHFVDISLFISMYGPKK